MSASLHIFREPTESSEIWTRLQFLSDTPLPETPMWGVGSDGIHIQKVMARSIVFLIKNMLLGVMRARIKVLFRLAV